MSPSRKSARAATSKTYHHENLRRALLDAAIAHLRTGDVTGLTMQRLARAAGVTAGAPYHHFEDKVAVIAALAAEGYTIWLERARRLVADASSPTEQLAALANSWLRFAATHPSHYRVMFLPDIEDRERFASLHAISGEGLAILLQVIARGLPNASHDVVKARAVVALSTLHGFASLRSAGVLANIPSLPGVTRLELEAVSQVVVAAFAEDSPSAP